MRKNMLLVMMVMVVMMMTMMIVSGDGGGRYRCQQMRGECRLVTWEEEGGVMVRNISCYCKHGEEVSYPLEQLSQVNCMDSAGRHVNTSIVHITGCAVNQLFPRSFLSTCRASTHMSLYLNGCPWVSISSPETPPSQNESPSIFSATFINSNVSGIPAGVVSGVSVRATLRVEGGQIGVLESRAFSDYPTNAYVSIKITNATLLTIKQGAIDLPPAAQMNINGGQVIKFESNSYSGGSELSLNHVRVGNLLPSCINIYGLKKLHVINCTMAAIYAKALDHRPTTYTRVVTAGRSVLKGSEAVFSGNNFMSGNGEAFIQLCTVETVVWKDNIMELTSDMPFKLQDPNCYTSRDWNKVFYKSGLDCQNCSHFANSNEQTCALYENGYCLSCDKALDGCNKAVLPYLATKCIHTHPLIAKELDSKCNAGKTTSRFRNPKLLDEEAKTQDGGGGGGTITPLFYLMVVCVLVTY